MIAWRVDFFEQLGDTKAVIETAQGLRGLAGMPPIIFTCRLIKEGGEPIAIDDDQVVDPHTAAQNNIGTERNIDHVHVGY